MSKTPLLTTGLQGLIGSKLAADFSDLYEFESLDIHQASHPVDITNLAAVQNAFKNSQAKAVVHLAAYTDVTGAWQQRGDENGLAYQVNVIGTRNIVQAAAETDKHVIHISTAYVFDGEKKAMYLESDQPNPIEWYGTTKYLAEQEVQKGRGSWCILRIDQPFRSDAFSKPDAVRKIVNLVQRPVPPTLFNDHWFGPTFIDDFVKVIDWVARTNQTGLLHATNGESWSDFGFATLICQKLNIEPRFTAGSLNEYLKTAQRPYQRNTALNTKKLQDLIDFPLHTIESAVSLVTL